MQQKDLINLHKALIGGYNEIAGTDINLAEEAVTELAAAQHPLIFTITAHMADAPLYDQRIIPLPPGMDLEVTKLDSGLYDVTVVCSDPNLGTYGDKILVLNKMTVESIIQALKAKDLIEAVISAPAPIEPPAPINTNPLADLQHALHRFKGDLHIHIQKAAALPVGTTKEWGGKKYVKHEDGWVCCDNGPHHGKLFAKTKDECTHRATADKHSDNPKSLLEHLLDALAPKESEPKK